MEMYSPAQLSEIHGDWNPMTYIQGAQQSELAQQFQTNKFAQQQQKLEADSLANQFTRQNNPQLLEKQRLSNEQTDYENMTKGVAGRNAIATEGLQLDAQKRKFLLDASEDDIKSMAAKAQQMAYSDDPVIQAKGKKLMMLSTTAVEARQKHAEQMEIVEKQRASAERIAAGNNAASRYGADVRASTANSRQGLGKTVEQALMGAKNSDQRVGIFESAARKAILEGDDQNAQYYQQMAIRERQGRLDERAAGANANAGAKPDIAGLTPRGTVPAASVGPLPGMAPATPQPKPQGNVPEVGAVHKGYVFLGGDPSKPTSWRKQ